MGNVLVSFYIFFAEATFQLQYHLMTKKPSKARWVLFKDRAKLAIFWRIFPLFQQRGHYSSSDFFRPIGLPLRPLHICTLGTVVGDEEGEERAPRRANACFAHHHLKKQTRGEKKGKGNLGRRGGGSLSSPSSPGGQSRTAKRQRTDTRGSGSGRRREKGKRRIGDLRQTQKSPLLSPIFSLYRVPPFRLSFFSRPCSIVVSLTRVISSLSSPNHSPSPFSFSFFSVREVLSSQRRESEGDPFSSHTKLFFAFV